MEEKTTGKTMQVIELGPKFLYSRLEPQKNGKYVWVHGQTKLGDTEYESKQEFKRKFVASEVMQMQWEHYKMAIMLGIILENNKGIQEKIINIIKNK